MDELIKAMGIKELERMKQTYKTNESIVKILDGAIQLKQTEAIREKAKEDFVKGIEALSATLPHPENIANVYMAWREVEIPKAIPEDASDARIAELKANPDKVTKWVVEVNKGFAVARGVGINQTTISKRAIRVSKRNGNTLEPVGNFRSGNEAVTYLNLALGGDSSTRVLTRNGYILDAYVGTDFKVTPS